jgi:7-cyano-7-deazaguanine synthase in queuosine biosynthesis
MKKIVCLASGGLDSTYMMIKNLEAGHQVQPIYVDTDINKSQKKAELNALENICHKLRNIFDDKISGFVKIPFDWISAQRLTLTQPQVWITAAHLYCQNAWQNENIDEVQIGYILGDQANSYQKEMCGLYNSLNKFIQPNFFIPKLTFPISKIAKYFIVDYLAQNKYNEIFVDCVYCEEPVNGERCGKCYSCRAAADAGIEQHYKYVEHNLSTKNILSKNLVANCVDEIFQPEFNFEGEDEAETA